MANEISVPKRRPKLSESTCQARSVRHAVGATGTDHLCAGQLGLVRLDNTAWSIIDIKIKMDSVMVIPGPIHHAQTAKVAVGEAEHHHEDIRPRIAVEEVHRVQLRCN